MIWIALLLPFLLQTLVIGLDEYCFHVKRGLPLWERIGHPLDTLTVLGCLLFAVFMPYSTFALKWYIALCLFSCLMITKDEFVHKHHCPGSEHWLHALLFINHPVMLGCIGVIWWTLGHESLPNWLSSCENKRGFLNGFLITQSVFVSIFVLYQIIYWNFIWTKKKLKDPA